MPAISVQPKQRIQARWWLSLILLSGLLLLSTRAPLSISLIWPKHYYVSALDVRLAAGQELSLGRQELGALQADAQHLRLRRQLDGSWWLVNASSSRSVRWQGDDGSTWHSRLLPLRRGQCLYLAARKLCLQAVEKNDLQMLVQEVDAKGGLQEVSWIWRDKRLWREGQQLASCPGRWPWSGLLSRPTFDGVKQELQLGGIVRCGNKLAWPEFAPAALLLQHKEDGWWLRVQQGMHLVCPQNIENGAACSLEHSQARVQTVLNTNGTLYVGRSAYRLQMQGEHLHLRALGKFALHAAPQSAVPGLEQEWRMLDFWQAPHIAYLSWAALCALLCLCWSKWATGTRQRAAAQAQQICMLATLGGWALAAWLQVRLGQVEGIGWLFLLPLAAGGCLYHQYQQSRLTAGTGADPGLLCFCVLLAFACLSQYWLAREAADSAALRFYAATLALSSLVLILLSLYLYLMQTATWRARLAQLPLERGLSLLAGLALAGMACQVVLGDEAGVLGALQPLELAKLALILLSAHALALHQANLHLLRSLRHDWRRWAAGCWWQYLLPVLIFVCLLVLALVSVRDFSPLLLLSCWAWGLALAWAWARRSWLQILFLLMLAALGLAALIALYRGEGMLATQFWSDRLDVWRNPGLHPYTGMQFLQAWDLMQQGLQGGIDGQSGISHAWQVPEIQNDFMPAFFIARFGFVGVQMLLAVQILYVLLLLRQALRSLRQAGDGDFRQRHLALLRYFALCGGAALLAAHGLLSWACNLGYLPVMGQPMPFLSAAGSMLLLFLFPLQLLGTDHGNQAGITAN